MSLTTGALATLRGPAPSREKYPEWTVTRTERLPPSRKCKPELLGEDGMREYSFFECVNGCGVGVKVLSDSLKQHKNQAIDDHLSTCQAIEEADRPAKVARGGIPVSILNDPEKMALVPALHKQCNERYEAVMEEVKGVKARLDTHEYVFRKVFPSMPLPIREGDCGVEQVRDAIKVDVLKDSSTTLVAVNPPSLDSDGTAVELALRREKHKSAVLERKLEVSERDLLVANEKIRHLESGRELRLAQTLHKREIDTLADADSMLFRLDAHLQTVFTEFEALAGTERAWQLRQPLAKEVADFKQRRERHRRKCAKRSRNVNSDVGSDSE